MTDGQAHTIRIFGHGASGKSTLAQEICNLRPAETVNLLETDPYILKNDSRSLVVPKDFPSQKVTASLPAAHELNSLARDIRMLQLGMDVMTIEGPWAPSQLLRGDKPLLIVEGMSTAFLKPDMFDLSIACFTDSETELERRLGRDILDRGRDLTFVKETHAIRRQQYEMYLQPFLNQAHILVDQTKNGFSAQFVEQQR
ncbi:phosphoribulokinase [Streptococcus sp. X13SY08]|uniref:phosphoribulokinase n=1 Tax=Streptococcus sp. X13SY08 TaxID=1676616 RepID=UPI001F22AE16|nr:phosphoribulokinase [Streptococcus sp. X13SY08]